MLQHLLTYLASAKCFTMSLITHSHSNIKGVSMFSHTDTYSPSLRGSVSCLRTLAPPASAGDWTPNSQTGRRLYNWAKAKGPRVKSSQSHLHLALNVLKYPDKTTWITNKIGLKNTTTFSTLIYLLLTESGIQVWTVIDKLFFLG